MTAEVCAATGKRRLDKTGARSEAGWWRRRWLACMTAYHCRRCGAWHVGNNRAKPRRVRP